MISNPAMGTECWILMSHRSPLNSTRICFLESADESNWYLDQ